VRGRSCGTNLIKFFEKDTETFDTGEAFVMYLDFAKAFIKVLHERLQKKLIAHRIKGDLLGWVRSRLSNRGQQVILNRKFSTWVEMLSDIPQDSALVTYYL
jgi:hypothetical protein